MKEVKFHTLYSEPNGVREEIPALKGKDSEVFGVKVAGADLVPDADGNVNVPFANSTTAGVAVVATWKGVEIASNGELRGVVVNGATYPTRGNDYIMSKGTLENAKEDIVRRSLTYNSQITDEDYPSIQETIGLSQFKKVADVRGTNETMADVVVQYCDDGLPMSRYKSAYVFFETPVQETPASVGYYGQIHFMGKKTADFLFNAENGAWTQAANASATGMYAESICFRGMRLSMGGTTQLNTNSPTLRKRYMVGFNSQTGVAIDNGDTLNFIRVKNVTGTWHIAIWAAE